MRMKSRIRMLLILIKSINMLILLNGCEACMDQPHELLANLMLFIMYPAPS